MKSGRPITQMKKPLNFDDLFSITLDRPVRKRQCDFPGCGQVGEYRAPKNKQKLNEHYWFCLKHVREYNEAWNFFSGMSEGEIEDYIRNATVWERPSWPLGEWQKRENDLRNAVDREFFGGEGNAGSESDFRQAYPRASENESLALAELELVLPVDFAAIKAKYKLMVKKHHPDANAGSPESEEKFKAINHAFTVLRVIYGTEESE